MRNAFVLLSFFAFAAASSAQVLTLSPIAHRGYSRTSADVYTFSRGWRAEFALPTPPADTRLVFARFDTGGSSGTSGGQVIPVWTDAAIGMIPPVVKSWISRVWSGTRIEAFTLSAAGNK